MFSKKILSKVVLAFIIGLAINFEAVQMALEIPIQPVVVESVGEQALLTLYKFLKVFFENCDPENINSFPFAISEGLRASLLNIQKYFSMVFKSVKIDYDIDTCKKLKELFLNLPYDSFKLMVNDLLEESSKIFVSYWRPKLLIGFFCATTVTVGAVILIFNLVKTLNSRSENVVNSSTCSSTDSHTTMKILSFHDAERRRRLEFEIKYVLGEYVRHHSGPMFPICHISA